MKQSKWTPWVFVGSGILVLVVLLDGRASSVVHNVLESFGPEPMDISARFDSKGKSMDPVTPELIMKDAYLKLESPVCVTGQNLVFEAYVPGDDLSWVGVVPASIPHGSESLNNEHNLSSAFLEDRPTRTIIMPCPSLPGYYDVRLHDRSDGREIRSAHFEARLDLRYGLKDTQVNVVSEKVLADGDDRKVVVDIYVPDSFSDEAWVGLVPSGLPHNSKDVIKKYIIQRVSIRKGSMQRVTLDVRNGRQSYDVRLYENASVLSEVNFSPFRALGPILCR